MTVPKVQPGDRFRPNADDWNSFADVANAFDRTRVGTNDDPRFTGFNNFAYVQNNTGAVLLPFSIVGLGGPLTKPTDSLMGFLTQISFGADIPTVQHLGQFGITLNSVEIGKIGRIALAGIVPALVEMENDGDEYADVLPGSVAKLRSGAGTARLLYVQPRADRVTPSEAQCYVQLGAKEWESWVKLTGATAVAGNSHRWKYNGVEQRPTWDGTTLGYSDRPSGQTWSGLVWNPPETNNTNARGLQPSTGVNQTGTAYPTGFDVKPLAAGLVVPVKLRRIATAAGVVSRIPWIVYQNADDGVCS